MTRYVTYDVFTDQPFGGNPLAVVLDADQIAEDQLQNIAAEFNYSETVFLYPPSDPANTAGMRIFTPTMEVPFAGHPTIGTLIALSDLGLADQHHGDEMRLELPIGLITARVENGIAEFSTTTPLTTLGHPSRDLVSRVLGLYPDQIASQPVIAGVGLNFTFTELTSRAALSTVQIDIPAMREGAEKFPESLDFAQAAYFRAGDTVHLRMFAPLDNIPEDPATGSAAAALVRLLSETEGRDLSLTLHQGQDMGRPSLIGARVEGDKTLITGQAVKMFEGRFAF